MEHVEQLPTVETAKKLGILPEEFEQIKQILGRTPNFTELSIFSVIVEKNPPAMLLFRSFMVSLLDKSEKMMPSLTPDNFIDTVPRMHALPL